VRSRIEDLVAMIDEIDQGLDITMTTNGVPLKDKAETLRCAAPKRSNISLDTFSIDRFMQIARRDAFDRVMAGIAAADEAGLRPVKLNVVVMKSFNDDEVVEFARLARRKPYSVRFIEFMPLDGDDIWSNDLVVPGRRIQEQIEDLFPLVAVQDDRPRTLGATASPTASPARSVSSHPSPRRSAAPVTASA
jgi:cyclic pyranopterin phosphate synthase